MSDTAYFFEYPATDRYTDVDYDEEIEKNKKNKEKKSVLLAPNANKVTTKIDTRPGTVPCVPPWSTWSGRIHCDPNSWVGKMLRADPASKTIPLVFDKAVDGKSINSIEADGYSKGVKAYGKEDWINGMWFAPEDWSKVPMSTERTPNRKRVPDWVAQMRYEKAAAS